MDQLDWLEYNLKRSLGLECTDDEEQHLGTVQVTETMNALLGYADIILEIEDWVSSRNGGCGLSLRRGVK